LLSAFDGDGGQLAQIRVLPSYKLTLASATAWIEDDFRKSRTPPG